MTTTELMAKICNEASECAEDLLRLLLLLHLDILYWSRLAGAIALSIQLKGQMVNILLGDNRSWCHCGYSRCRDS